MTISAKRISVAAAALLAAGALLVPGVMAETGGGNTCSITDNGARSRNRCKITVKNKTVVKQKNNANVSNTVVVSSNTGGNKANNNTGGTVDTQTGDSSTTISITNTVNRNVITVGP